MHTLSKEKSKNQQACITLAFTVVYNSICEDTVFCSIIRILHRGSIKGILNLKQKATKKLYSKIPLSF